MHFSGEVFAVSCSLCFLKSSGLLVTIDVYCVRAAVELFLGGRISSCAVLY